MASGGVDAMLPVGSQICSWPVHQIALDNRSNEFALLDRFARPVAVAIIAVRRPSRRARAEAAVDAGISHSASPGTGMAIPLGSWPRSVVYRSSGPAVGTGLGS